ncbi:MAG: hypothetical protein K6G22_02885 [Lachnospiraceae bacterium]|nr:hypothetical protein [Lachnospiraceae bacterium]
MNSAKTNKKIIISSSLIFAAGILIMFVTHDNGFIPALKWLLSICLTAFFLRPALSLQSIKPFDGGFSLSFCLGLAIAFSVSWFFSALNIVRFDTFTVYLGLLIPALLCNLIVFTKKRPGRFRWSEEQICKFFFGLALFVFLFAIAFYIKGFRSDIGEQTEQFMDFGFMQSIFRQKQVPPEDLWFSGETLNYYYLGHAAAVYLCRLAFITPEYGYNFMLCTIFSALFMTVFTVTQAVCAAYHRKNTLTSVIGGAVATAFTVLGANGHYYIFGLIRPLIFKITGNGGADGYWFADPTAYIGHYEGSMDLGKHEYPSYTLVLGDLHAHVCNMLFTIPLIAVLFDYVLYMSRRANDRKAVEEKTVPVQSSGSVPPDAPTESLQKEAPAYSKDVLSLGETFEFIKNHLRELFSPYILIAALLLGLYKGTNYWDFPIYFVISGAVILFTDLKYYGKSLCTLLFVLLKGIVILLFGTILMIPFNLRFVKMSSELRLCDRHSPFLQYMTVWWPFILFMTVFLVYLIRVGLKRGRREAAGNETTAAGEATSGKTSTEDEITAATVKAWIKNLVQRLNDIFDSLSFLEFTFLILILCALGLIIMPEIIYINDIYGSQYQRYNTMFKLTFQAFILFGMLTGISVAIFWEKKGPLKIYAVFVLCMGILSGTYILDSIGQWMGPVYDTYLRYGISAFDFMRAETNDYSDEWYAIQRLNADDREHIHIVEVAGDSYSPDCKLSVFTGTCTVAGWYVHEWMWRTTYYYIEERAEEVRQFYEGGDPGYCREFLEKYDVDYIYLGPREYMKYYINTDGFMQYADGIWNDPDTNTTLITVNKHGVRDGD